MSRLLWLVLASTALALTEVRAAYQITAPAFAWSNLGYFRGDGGKQSHIQSLQVHHSLYETLEQLLDGVHSGKNSTFKQWLNNHSLDQQRPDVLLTVLGSELKSSDLKARAMQGTLQPLKALLDQAASSLSAPYVLHQGATRDEQLSRLQQLAAGLGLVMSVVGCSAESHSSLDEAVQNSKQGPHVVVLCTQPPSAGAAGSSEALAAELQQVQEAHDKVAQLGKRQLTIYAAVPEGLQARRQLQGVQADVGTCGQLCQTQVKWLEGILAVLILAIAAFSGMCCLSMLDTPTRFEKPKEAGRND